MSIILIASNALETLTQFNFKAALIQRQENIEESVNTAWVLNILRGGILALCIYISAPYIALFYNEPVIAPAIKYYSLIFLLNGFSNINIFLFDKELNFKKIAVFRIAIGAVNLLIVVLLAFIMKNIWALIYSYILGSLFEILLSYLIQNKKPKFYFNKHVAKELLSYSLFITGTGILLFLTTKIDDALIGKVLGMTALGYYTYAYKLANLPSTQVTGVLSQVLFPSYSSIQNDIMYLRSLFLKVIKFIAFISIPASAGIFVASDSIVYIILGQKWMPLVPALKILCIFGLLRSLGSTTSPIFQAIGKPNIIFYVMLVKFVFIGLIIYPLTYRYGIEGTAWAVTLPMMFEQIYLWRILSKVLQVSISTIVGRIKTAIAGSAGMLMLLHFLKNYFDFSLGAFLMYIFIGLVTYIGITIAIDKEYYKELLRTFSVQ